jgi:hypothetical protein
MTEFNLQQAIAEQRDRYDDVAGYVVTEERVLFVESFGVGCGVYDLVSSTERPEGVQWKKVDEWVHRFTQSICGAGDCSCGTRIKIVWDTELPAPRVFTNAT